MFAAHDLLLGKPGENLAYVCVYGRLSVLCGALALATCAASIEWRPRPLVTTISRYSLGIYAVHKYWQYLCLEWAARHPGALPWNAITVIVTVAGTAATVAVLARTPLRRFVT